MMTTTHVSSTLSTDEGGRLVATTNLVLPLVAVAIEADARGGLARVTLQQRFRNPHATPLIVSYSFPLPADAAVSGYAFTVGDKRVVGEVDRREAARERFERAILEGKTSALLEQDRSSLFTQEIGNVPPGADVVVELVIDQRLIWISEGAWEWRFPTAAAPRYLGASGRVADAARVAIDVADAKLPVRASLALAIRDAVLAARKPESPSHRVVTSDRPGAAVVALDAEAGAPLDRDLVVRWPVAQPAAGATLDVARPREGAPHAAAAYGLVTIVPPAREGRGAALARDLVVLLDTSGSMNGAPLEQARRVVAALISTLGERDRLELIEFSSAPRRWKKEAVAANAANRSEALSWLAGLRASGGTEMKDGILAALHALRAESQRQVVLVTDGQIGFETEIVSAILAQLPPGACVHTVGVGSAVNRSLTAAAARAGRGVEVVIGLDEDPERAARRIVARTDAPLVIDVTLEGSALLATAPARCPALFASTPVLVGATLRAEGGELVVRGRTEEGAWETRMRVPPCAHAEGSPAVIALFGREQVEDLEMKRASGEASGEIDRAIERIGLDFQIATRLTSWVAIAEERAVDPTEPMRRVRMPQELPYGMSMEGLGLRGGGPMLGAAPAPAGVPFAMASMRPRGAFTGAGTMARRVMPPSQAARPPSAPPAPAAPSVLERAARAMKGFLGSSDDLSGGAPHEELTSARAGGLRGRIFHRKDDSLVIEIDVEGTALAWKAALEVAIAWDDGRTSRARVVATPSTRTIAPGETFRLSLRLTPDDVARAAAPRTITIGYGADAIVVDL